SGNAGPVTVHANILSADGAGRTDFATGVFSNASRGSSGKAGLVTVTANAIDLRNQGMISSSTFGPGDAGPVTVNANTLSADGAGNANTGVFSDANNNSTGKAGPVTVAASAIDLRNAGKISSRTYSTGNAGQVQLTGIGTNTSLTIDGGASTGGTGVVSTAVAGSSGAAGNVSVSMDNIRLFHTGTISSSTFSSGNAGPVTVHATTLSADGAGGVFSNADRGSSGKAGPITVTANAIDLRNQGVISSSTFGPGDAGPVTVNANAIDLRNYGEINSSTSGPGNAGQVQLTGIGTNSSLTIDAGGSAVGTGAFSVASAGSSGAAGSVAVSMDNIRLFRTGAISSSTFSSGNAGPVTVHANILSADGAGRTDFATGVFSNASRGSSGKAGPITVTANAIDLRNQGQISSSTFGSGQGGSVIVRTGQLLAWGSAGLGDVDTGISTNANLGTGSAGDIQVFADAINLLTNGRISSSSLTSGHGGNVEVAGNMRPLELMISGPGAGIRARATSPAGSGAGTIGVAARTISVMDQGEITTSAEAGGGGQINLASGFLIRLDDGQITTSVRGGTGNSGDLTASSRFVVLNHSQILANADAGRGGSIAITAQSYFASPDSLVQASAARGINGIITVEAPQSNVAGTLAELPGNLLHPPTLQQRGCSALAQSQGLSSFTIGASGGLPRNGDGPQPAPYFELQQGATALSVSQPMPALAPHGMAMLDPRPTCPD
ncbi:MAG: beta strand repeat-containing protein, partial [Rhodopila sp.]